MNRFEFQQIGRKEFALTGDAIKCTPIYETFIDSKGYKHSIKVDEIENNEIYCVDDLTETMIIDELNFIGEPFSNIVLHYPNIEERWLCKHIFPCWCNSIDLKAQTLVYLSSVLNEWKDKGVSIISGERDRNTLRGFIMGLGKELNYPIYFYGGFQRYCAVSLSVNIELFFENLWHNESLKKYLQNEERYYQKIYDCRTAEEAAEKLLLLRTKLK